MDKTKKIIISLGIALVITLILNGAILKLNNSNYIKIPVFKEAMLKGKNVTNKNITYIEVKSTKENLKLLDSAITANFSGKVLVCDVIQGEIVSDEKFSQAETLESNEKYKYISIPVSDLSYATCNMLKRGDKVTIYYTAKNKAVVNAIKDKQRLYSNNEQEGLVTCLLFETVEVISVHDNTGKEAKENVITDVLVRLNAEDAILVANLKLQGTFDIILN